MSNCCYVQLDAQNEVIGASQLKGQISHPALVETDGYRPDLIGHTYDPQTGTFTAPQGA